MSRKIKRRSQRPLARKSFVVIGDGETESWYIQKLKEHEKNNLDSLSLNLKPDFPVKKGLEESYKYIKDLEKENGYDKIFWIVDFDTIIKETKEAKKGKETKLELFRGYFKEFRSNEKIIIIINNPCLEYWFLQHFGKFTRYFKGYAGELEREIKKHILNYDKTGKFYNSCNGSKGIYSLLKPKLEYAISNSIDISNPKKSTKLNFDKTDINDYEIGTTEMHKLFEELKISK